MSAEDETATDAALLEAARTGLVAERIGLPLLQWQQRCLDRLYLHAEHSARLDRAFGPVQEGKQQ